MQSYLGEFVGTMFFLYVILATGNPVAIGVALVLAIMALGSVSGGHFNPAVTIMMAAAGRMEIDQVPGYVCAQILGGLAALEVFKRVQIK